jgi:hypothetical protein
MICTSSTWHQASGRFSIRSTSAKTASGDTASIVNRRPMTRMGWSSDGVRTLGAPVATTVMPRSLTMAPIFRCNSALASSAVRAAMMRACASLHAAMTSRWACSHASRDSMN